MAMLGVYVDENAQIGPIESKIRGAKAKGLGTRNENVLRNTKQMGVKEAPAPQKSAGGKARGPRKALGDISNSTTLGDTNQLPGKPGKAEKVQCEKPSEYIEDWGMLDTKEPEGFAAAALGDAYLGEPAHNGLRLARLSLSSAPLSELGGGEMDFDIEVDMDICLDAPILEDWGSVPIEAPAQRMQFGLCFDGNDEFGQFGEAEGLGLRNELDTIIDTFDEFDDFEMAPLTDFSGVLECY